MTAMFAALSAYVVANGVGIGARVLPVVLFAIVVLVEWYTDDAWHRAGLIVVGITGTIAGLDIAGYVPKLPAFANPVTPAK